MAWTVRTERQQQHSPRTLPSLDTEAVFACPAAARALHHSVLLPTRRQEHGAVEELQRPCAVAAEASRSIRRLYHVAQLALKQATISPMRSP